MNSWSKRRREAMKARGDLAIHELTEHLAQELAKQRGMDIVEARNALGKLPLHRED